MMEDYYIDGLRLPTIYDEDNKNDCCKKTVKLLYQAPKGTVYELTNKKGKADET